MKRSFIETVIGALVIVVAAVFLFYAYSNSSLAGKSGYPVKAEFLSVGGLTNGSDVRLAGVKVGSVTGLTLDQENYVAIVTMSIDNALHLPEDTVVTVVSDGLLGGRYVSLDPGTSKTMVEANGDLKNTRDVKTLEQILGEAIYVIADQSGGQTDSGSSGGSPSTSSQ